ncbi:MAG: DUF5658 family protein [Candidatus Bathyarchaeota archaeon]|nr:DUF5658 family protein [Candidatus Bathyarchaeota archaeon]
MTTVWLLALYVLLQFLDAAITVYGVNAGLLSELNPLVQPTNLAHVALKAFATVVTAWLIWFAYKRAVAANSQVSIRLVYVATAGLTLWYAFVAVHNLYHLFL